MDRGVLAKWHKQPGDSIAYGDDLCDIDVGEVLRISRRLSAFASSVEIKSNKAKFHTGNVGNLRYCIRSAETGTLSELRVSEGTAVTAGDTLAILVTGDGTEAPDSKPLLPARVVVNRVGDDSS